MKAQPVLPFMPYDLSDTQIAFGAADLMADTFDWNGNGFFPSREKIPEEFLNWDSNKWCEFVSSWFFKGLPANVEFHPVKGIDPEKAHDHILAALGSWTPKHEHKIAALGYLASLWFTDVKVDGKSIVE